MKAPMKRAAELTRLAALAEHDIDTSDIPETSGWSKAVVGKFYRPVKQQVTLRIDADVLNWFKTHSGKYQSAVNAALREHVATKLKKAGKTGKLG
ncbi:MAG: BrnA antitoxin family protein [Hyphomicrobium sp.]